MRLERQRSLAFNRRYLAPSEYPHLHPPTHTLHPHTRMDVHVLSQRIGFSPRLGAALLDFLFMTVTSLILSLIVPANEYMSLFSELGGGNSALGAGAALFSALVTAGIVVNLVRLAYYSLEIIVGQSVGKMIMNIRIAGVDGEKASTGSLFVRYLWKHGPEILSLFVYFGIAAFGFLSVLWTIVVFIGLFWAMGKDGMALHDRVAKTAIYPKDAVGNILKESDTL